ncbi:CPBP family intramembrane glutamic endopeptidase [Nitriliruptor alkaliphilus]|uniref:CPBP family intramembrane glutamic endopeptidase n=1 Tax=Nitriliruptor alkaliphilus TaxID=427918 RepID=UPI0006965230|nr:type II CAAX endopeptidase family protein [Nitriliruptor alkaliphilus]
MRALARRHPLAAFFVLAFAVTWVVWVPRALVGVGALDSDWPVTIGRAWSWGPLVAALLAAALVAGRAGPRELWQRLTRVRVPRVWYAVIVLGPALVWSVAAGLAVLFGQPFSALRPGALELGPIAFLPVFMVLTLTDGFGEEGGWRGYALPLLLLRFRAVPASLLLGVAWAAWHLPLAWTEGASLESAPVVLLFIDLPFTAIVYTWVFRHTRGSAFVAAIFHAALNLWAIPMPQGGGASLTPYLFGLGSRIAVACALMLLLGSELTRDRSPEDHPPEESAQPVSPLP